MKQGLPRIAAAALLLCGSAAFADQFDLTWTGAYGPGDAILTATSEGGGDWLVTSITGTQNGKTITGLLAPGTYGGNDNEIFPFASPEEDSSGLAFTAGKAEFNLFFDDLSGNKFDGDYAECKSTKTSCTSSSTLNDARKLGSFSITPVPLPNAAWLMLCGLGALFAVSRNKKRPFGF
jgi:hypothetical protein